MSFLSIGDLSSSTRLRFLNADIKNNVATLATELATGKVSDPTRHLGGNLDRLGSLNRSLKMLDAYKVSLSEQVTRGSGLQVSLAALQAATQTTGANTVAAANTITTASISAAATSASESMNRVLATLNSQISGRSLFAGQAFKSPAVVSASVILDNLAVLVAGATGAGAIKTIVDDYFAAGGGFENSAYLGADEMPGAVRVSATETARFPVSANNPEIRGALAGLAMAALLTRDVLAGDLPEQANLLKSAGETMLSATERVISLRAEIGGIEERLEHVSVGLAAQKTALELMLGEILSVKPYETATRLQAAEASLEALYIATTRLSQLSLTRFLR